MTVKDYKGNKHEILTIEELYLWAKEQGLENSGIGMGVYDEDTDFEYCAEVKLDDIEIGGYYINGKKTENCPMVWIYNH